MPFSPLFQWFIGARCRTPFSPFFRAFNGAPHPPDWTSGSPTLRALRVPKSNQPLSSLTQRQRTGGVKGAPFMPFTPFFAEFYRRCPFCPFTPFFAVFYWRTVFTV